MHLAARLVSAISRRTKWTEGHVFTFAPEQFAVFDGVRTALAVAALLSLALHFDDTNFAFGAIAAFWTSLCDPLGPTPRRLRAMAAFAVLGALAVSLASFAAHFGPPTTAAALFILTFLCLLTRNLTPAFGPVPAQGGFLAAIAVIVGLASPQDIRGATALGACFLLGSLCMIAVAMLPKPLSRTSGGRMALVSIFSRLDEMLGVLIDAGIRGQVADPDWFRFDTLNRRAIRFAIERGRETVARSGHPIVRYSLMIDAASATFSALVAIGHDLKWARAPSGVAQDLDVLKTLREGLQTTLDEMERDGDGKAVLSEAERLMAKLPGRADLFANAIVLVATNLKDLGKRWNERHSHIKDTARPNFGIKVPSAVLWHSLRTSIAVLVSHLVGVWFGLALSYWGAIATIVVMQPLTGNTWLRVLERGAGSLLGGLMAAVAIAFASSHLAMAMMVVPLCAVVIALRLVNYGLFVVFLTPMFMLMTDYVHPSDNLIWDRVLNEALGAFIGIAAGILLSPRGEKQNLADTIVTAIAANLAFASAVSGRQAASKELERLESEAGIASSRLETTYERLWLEGRGRSRIFPPLWELIVALRGVCGAAAARKLVHPVLSEIDELAEGDRYHSISDRLQDAIRSSARPPPSETGEVAGDDLDARIQMLILAVQAYIDASG